MLKNLWIEYFLRQVDGEGKFGPFGTEAQAFECVVIEKLSEYQLIKVLSYIPF